MHDRQPLKVVALGGGHGLYASLSALQLLDTSITAVVTVADDGGSSGRIRRELGVLPPGDLRMALAALSSGRFGSTDPTGEASAPTDPTGEASAPTDPTGEASAPTDPTEQAEKAEKAGTTSRLPWSSVLQHRLGGTGALAGHPIGNLLLTGLLELHADAVVALDELAELVGARGRVLPMCRQPLDLIAEVSSVDADDPVQRRRIRGQSAIAATAGRVTSITLLPPDPPACAEAVQAIMQADVVILGPGSWFTSVIPHLLVPGLADALIRTTARRIIILNLEQQVGETDGFSPEEHLRALAEHCPSFAVDVVIADSESVLDPRGLRNYADRAGARLVLAPVAASDEPARHDPGMLSMAVADAAGLNPHEAGPNDPGPDSNEASPDEVGTDQADTDIVGSST